MKIPSCTLRLSLKTAITSTYVARLALKNVS
jgi:hypothetical protein